MPATILVVDDESLIRWTLAERLGADGHVVVEAETAKAALARFGSDIDLVLLDFKLPDSDGLTVLKTMKAKDADVPVILLTAFSSIETAVEAMKQGRITTPTSRSTSTSCRSSCRRRWKRPGCGGR